MELLLYFVFVICHYYFVVYFDIRAALVLVCWYWYVHIMVVYTYSMLYTVLCIIKYREIFTGSNYNNT